MEENNQVILQILEERTPLYNVYSDLLTSSQYALLKAMANEILTEQPTLSRLAATYHLGAASTVKRSLEALESKRLIYYEEGKYSLLDVFLMRWIQRQ